MKTAATIEAQDSRKDARDNDSQEDSSPELRQPVKQKSRRGDASRIAAWRFQPGRSGNPGGVPKHDVSKEIAQAVFLQNPEMIYKAYCKMMAKGNAYCFQVLAERAWGKLKERIEVEAGPLRSMTEQELEERAAELQRKLGLAPETTIAELQRQLEEARALLPPASDDSKPN